MMQAASCGSRHILLSHQGVKVIALLTLRQGASSLFSTTSLREQWSHRSSATSLESAAQALLMTKRNLQQIAQLRSVAVVFQEAKGLVGTLSGGLPTLGRRRLLSVQQYKFARAVVTELQRSILRKRCAGMLMVQRHFQQITEQRLLHQQGLPQHAVHAACQVAAQQREHLLCPCLQAHAV